MSRICDIANAEGSAGVGSVFEREKAWLRRCYLSKDPKEVGEWAVLKSGEGISGRGDAGTAPVYG